MGLKPEHLISAVEPDSIAADLGLQPGDFLLQMDGSPLIDIFDYRLRQLKGSLLLTVRQQGELIQYEIEKDEDEDLGLSFANPMLQDCTACDNHCLFCFIDQLPQGLRTSLYFKDDDLRLSFLSGNYATLTNLSDEPLDRLIRYRFSPMNVSVHTTNPRLRIKMIRHKGAGRLFSQLQRIAAAGITLNCQIVLCPGINDGIELEQTLTDLLSLGPAVSSIALVPVGLTRFRVENKLFPLRLFSTAEAGELIDQVHTLQRRSLRQRGTRLLYAADEFYLKAQRPLPCTTEYEDYPQLENGVGMAALMLSETERALADPEVQEHQLVWQAVPGSGQDRTFTKDRTVSVWLATGTAAAPLLAPYTTAFAQRAGCPVQVKAITNRFFGATVTVAGLLTGRDLLDQMQPDLQAERARGLQPLLVLPSCQFKADQPVLLDDLTLQQLSDRLAVSVWVSRPQGNALVGLLDQVRAQAKGVSA